jgi:hypothetical protein
MRTRYLLTRLVLPLVMSAAVCVFVSLRVPDPWKGLAVNMAAAFLGSIVTVFYVDVVLSRHKAALWARVRSKVYMRLERLANASISSVRVGFGLEPPALPRSNHVDLALMREEMLRLAEQILMPALPGVAEMDQRDWRTLALNLQGTVSEVNSLLTLFSRTLDVEYTAVLLELQEVASLILSNYSTWPDLLGVAEGSLPRKRDGSSNAPFQRALNQGISADIERLLAKCSQILRSLPPQGTNSNGV